MSYEEDMDAEMSDYSKCLSDGLFCTIVYMWSTFPLLELYLCSFTPHLPIGPILFCYGTMTSVSLVLML